MRGMATGLLTAALAVAAHGVVGGGLPRGAATALLAVLAAAIGSLAATVPRADRLPALFGLLAVGQLLGHLMLSAAGHHHPESTAPPAVAMLAAHLLAIVVGAALIVAGDRLWRALFVQCALRSEWSVRWWPGPRLRCVGTTSHCAQHFCLPLRCRTGVRRSASPADRPPPRHKKAANE